MEIISKKPFLIFKKKNFLTKKFYSELENNFPYKILNPTAKKNSKRFPDEDGKFHFSAESLDDLKEANIHKSYIDLYKFFEKQSVKNLFLNIKKKNLCMYDFFQIRKKIWLPAIKRNIIKNMKTTFQFSHIKYGKINPHTDVTRNIISLMLYMPSKENSINNTGTTFYLPKKNTKKKWAYWYSVRILDDKFKDFDKDHNKLNLGFEKNTLVGFGKNMYSWHGVDQINRDIESDRRSLNIFYELYE